jgi:signal transduction histidine kinase
VKRPRLTGSLLFTFTAAFLAVLVVGAVAQFVLTVSVLRPVGERWRMTAWQETARAAATHVAGGFAAGRTDVAALLRESGQEHRGLLLVYRGQDGDLTTSTPEGERPARLPGRLRLLDREGMRARIPSAPVVVDGETRGEIFVFPRGGPRRFPPPGVPSLIFLPLAAVLAGLSGFLLFRMLSRRIGHLEDRARRIADGDLSVRVRDTRGDEIGRLASAFDSMAARLEESQRRLIEADQQRRRFLADVTHDLATPLTSIRGYAETLLDPHVEKTKEEVERYLRTIEEEARRMDALVVDLLDLARVESGTVPLDRERIDLRALVAEEIDRARATLATAGLRLHAPEAGPAIEVHADRRRLEQLVANLLSNSAQHAPGGRNVWVTVRGDAGQGEITVEDDGPGFRQEDLPHVFDRFYRGDPARPAGGTGLGLAIVRGIARAHGGEALAGSRAGGGARVAVTLPCGPPPS